MNGNINSASPSAPAGLEINSITLESLNWEARYQAGDTPWDQGRAAPAVGDFLLRHRISGKVLVPGSGLGHEVRVLAGQPGMPAQVTGLDISATAITQARAISPAGSESHEQGDLFDLPGSWHGRFDWIVEHTCFCAIPPARRRDYIRAITQLLKPGGHYFAIFFMTPDVSQGPPFATTNEEISQLFDPHFDLLEEWVPKSTFAGREGRELCQLRRRSEGPTKAIRL